MSRIKGKDTQPEIYIRKLLFAAGYRYRIQVRRIPGTPDIWLRKYNTAIFVNGCFWHRHQDCKYSYTPKSRVEFWQSKFDSNVLRDKRIHEELFQLNTKCLIIWECTIRKMRKSEEYQTQVLNKINDFFKSDVLYQEL